MAKSSLRQPWVKSGKNTGFINRCNIASKYLFTVTLKHTLFFLSLNCAAIYRAGHPSIYSRQTKCENMLFWVWNTHTHSHTHPLTKHKAHCIWMAGALVIFLPTTRETLADPAIKLSFRHMLSDKKQIPQNKCFLLQDLKLAVDIIAHFTISSKRNSMRPP